MEKRHGEQMSEAEFKLDYAFALSITGKKPVMCFLCQYPVAKEETELFKTTEGKMLRYCKIHEENITNDNKKTEEQ